ncbi:HD domain-containing protein [Candidatus Saganbacteria bacterium]|nr:HD domain-containing protein [Candidatus Saganbacteria bacterium]
MKDKLLVEMEKYFGRDSRRIQHTRRVLFYAEQIIQAEPGDREIVTAAAILHDIGIHAAEKKHGSTAGRYQEIEGPPIAEMILERNGFPEDKTVEVLEIIGHHHSPGIVKTVNFNILYDADLLVNLGAEFDLTKKDELVTAIEKTCLTTTGKTIARQVYLP